MAPHDEREAEVLAPGIHGDEFILTPVRERQGGLSWLDTFTFQSAWHRTQAL